MDKDRNIEQKEKDLFSKLNVEYPRSKENVWGSMEALISDESVEMQPVKSGGRIAAMNLVRMSAAAAVALLIGLTMFAKFYTVSHEVEAGAFASHILPDGSKIDLNAESTVSWSPYWWRFNRSVDLAGEAFFDVEPGETFTVRSVQGTTEVLGTSFNIYARDEDYQVLCVTGKVKVTNSQGKKVILTPGKLAALSPGEGMQEVPDVLKESVLSWRQNKFVYNTTPLSKVFKDVERHYNIIIALDFDSVDAYYYTGLFERSVSPEKALEIICYSFDLELEKEGDHSFHIRQN